MRPILALLRRVAACRRGAAAIEFAIIATPFAFILFAIIELGLVFVVQIDLSNATMALARQIRTGSIMAAGSNATSGATLSLTDFKTAICSRIHLATASTCAAQLQVDIRTQSAFGTGQTAANPVSNGNFSSASLCYYSGQSGSTVEFRAFYLWQIFTPLLLSALINAKSYTVNGTTVTGNYRVITSAEAFRIEQNSSGSNAGSSC